MADVIAKEFLDVLACPEDKATLKQGKNGLICTKCKAEYPIKDGIPVLLSKK